MDGATAPQGAPGLDFTPEPVPALLDRTVAKFGSRPAIDFLGRRWTWKALGAEVDAAAAGLQRLGVRPGVHVGLCLPNTPYFVVLYYAILKAGGTVVNFNPLYTEREIAAQASDAEVRIVCTVDVKTIQDKIVALAARGAFDRVILCSLAAALPRAKALAYRLFKRAERAALPAGGIYTSYKTLIGGGGATPVVVDPASVAALQFTGGTTGTPKAAMLSHANIVVNVRQAIAACGVALVPGHERVLVVLPLFHVFAMTAAMNFGVACGAELLLLPKPEIKQIMKTLLRRRPTVLPGVPTLYAAIASAAEDGGARDLGFIKFCSCGGAPNPAEVAERFTRISGCQLMEGYGLSETAPILTMSRPGGMRPGAVGRPVPGTLIEIRDLERPERVLGAGERGEICARGPQVMLGYYKRPTETAAAFIDGAFRTGDVGYLDEDGYLFIVDRIKDLIICGGYNVYPRTIEEAAYRHEAVRDAVAVGVPDAYRGQAPKLFVTLRPGAAATEAEIRRYLAGQLNRIDMPRDVEIRDSLPKTPVGKFSKKELLAEEMAKGVGDDK